MIIYEKKEWRTVLPEVPCFIKTTTHKAGLDNKVEAEERQVHICDFSEADLKMIGEEWTEALLKLAKQKRCNP